MTEPFIGMKFGTYVEVTEQAFNGKKVTITQQTNENLYNGGRYVQDNMHTRDNNGTIWAFRGAIDPTSRDNEKQPELYAEVHITDAEGNVLIYDGQTYERVDSYQNKTSVDNTSDIKFNRIRGQELYALDLNYNGVVDAGEIFSIADCDGIKDQEILDNSHSKLNIEY